MCVVYGYDCMCVEAPVTVFIIFCVLCFYVSMKMMCVLESRVLCSNNFYGLSESLSS